MSAFFRVLVHKSVSNNVWLDRSRTLFLVLTTPLYIELSRVELKIRIFAFEF